MQVFYHSFWLSKVNLTDSLPPLFHSRSTTTLISWRHSSCGYCCSPVSRAHCVKYPLTGIRVVSQVCTHLLYSCTYYLQLFIVSTVSSILVLTFTVSSVPVLTFTVSSIPVLTFTVSSIPVLTFTVYAYLLECSGKPRGTFVRRPGLCETCTCGGELTVCQG